MSNFKMDDYVPVNERVDQFYSTFPEGSLQSEIIELTDSRVTVKASAYRKPDDPRPGIGHSSLTIPGSTPYTRGSEIENAETSAWGRAIAALGFEVKRGIASAEEVRNKAATEQPARPARPADGGTGGTDSPQRPPAPSSPEYEESPFANEPVDPALDAILAVTGGEVVDDGVQERIDRARAKGAPSGGDSCPEHGAAKVKQNSRGLYCATKVNGEWCKWTSKAAA